METRKNISVLIKPASSLCNLRCRYCFYSDVSENRSVASFGVMEKETMHSLVEKISLHLKDGGDAFISFQGGEPTVAGLEYFKDFVLEVSKHPDIVPHYSIQTNGTLIDENWAKFFKDHAFLVGVSLDGYQTNMDKFRYDPLKRGVFYKVLSGIEELKKADVDFNILTVVTSDLAKHPKALYKFFVEHHFEYIQLIPCLPGLEEQSNAMSLTPDLYASFYNGFFDCWKADYIKGEKYLNVNLFENIAGMLQGYPPYQCGMLGRCSQQFVVEGNGDVYPCDFYCLDEHKLGNIRELSFKQLSESKNAKDFINASDCKKKPCESCRYINICNGGCRRQNICYLKEDRCAYREVLDHIANDLYRFTQS